MDNKKEKPNTINNINKSIGQGGIFSENDPIDVNNLLTLADSDITPDLLMQLEQRAKEEQKKILYKKIYKFLKVYQLKTEQLI